MNRRDAILQELTPVIAVPRFEALEPDSRGDAHRFLVAKDGLWIEAELPWLSAKAPIALTERLLPFGPVQLGFTLKCGPIPKELLQRFTELAREATPSETAAIITWKVETSEFRLEPVTREAGNGHVHWERRRLSEGEYLVADLHSHGRYAARFSAQDDRDDCGEIKFSVVVGRCEEPAPQVAARLCLMGTYIPVEGSFTAGSIGQRKESLDETPNPS